MIYIRYTHHKTMNNTISEKQTPRTTLHNEDGKIIFNGLKSIPYEEARFLVDSEEFQAHITLAMAYYEALSFQEIVKGTQDEKNIIPLEKLLNLDTSGKFKQGIFSKICENNPRISERYDAGRLCMKNQGNNSVEFSILHKNAGLAIHIYHIDES